MKYYKVVNITGRHPRFRRREAIRVVDALNKKMIKLPFPQDCIADETYVDVAIARGVATTDANPKLWGKKVRLFVELIKDEGFLKKIAPQDFITEEKLTEDIPPVDTQPSEGEEEIIEKLISPLDGGPSLAERLMPVTEVKEPDINEGKEENIINETDNEDTSLDPEEKEDAVVENDDQTKGVEPGDDQKLPEEADEPETGVKLPTVEEIMAGGMPSIYAFKKEHKLTVTGWNKLDMKAKCEKMLEMVKK